MDNLRQIVPGAVSVSPLNSGRGLDQHSPHYQALGVVRQGAGLEGDDRFSLVVRVHYLDVVLVHYLLLRDAVDVGVSRGVGEHYLVARYHEVEVVKDLVRSRSRIAYAVPRDVNVRALLPRETRSRYVNGRSPQVLLGGRVVDGYALEPHPGHAEVHRLVLGATGVPPEVERLDVGYGPRRATAGLQLLDLGFVVL